MANSNQTTSAAGGTGTGFILFVVFLVLKLTEVIDWSWWWITAPLWIPFVLAAVVLAVAAVVALIGGRK